MRAVERRRMSYDDYLALPESTRAEWVDGEVVVNPPPSYHHQRSSLRIARILEDALPSLFVVEAAGIRLPGNRERIPDIMVLDREPEGPYVDYAAVLVVEILSPSTRTEDTVRKSAEYLAGDVGQYWILDPSGYCLDVLAGSGTEWKPVARLDEVTPEGRVEVGRHGVVAVDLRAVLGQPGPS
ncbi:MAG: Uma2 family endonuclease [Aeromicrobium sp.]|uniref:Uma2 family endonuclease n=1 Tax=Aeromicrobium sp. TaxID=1871063 RepID=UPI0039E5C04D